jgi:Zn-dependent peptidase ImmA (M78 family)/DNA-binding XRE family transcriptional regulator
MTIGDRIRQVREYVGLKQTELARRLQVSQSAIAQVENGTRMPSDEMLHDVSFHTGFPIDYFRSAELPEFPMGSLLFRAHASASSGERTRTHRAAELAFGVAEALSARIELIPVRIPRINESPSAAAQLTRAALGLSPDRPVEHLTHTLEKAGTLILALPRAADKVDAFSAWAGIDRPRPVIVVSSNSAVDRLRFNLAHELGHLVMHTPLRGTVASLEAEAHTFAAEFLLPASAMRDELPVPLTLSAVAPLKLRWKVSLQAIIRRAFDLSIITERQYRYLFQQIGARGWRKKEPASLSPESEKPRGFRKMIELVYGNPPNIRTVASDFRLPLKFVQELLQVHASATELPRANRLEVLRFDSSKKSKGQK